MKRTTWLLGSCIAAVGIVSCGSDVGDMVSDAMVDGGVMLMDAGRMLVDGGTTVSDATSSDASAQPATVLELTCDQMFEMERDLAGYTDLRQVWYAEADVTIDTMSVGTIQAHLCGLEPGGQFPGPDVGNNGGFANTGAAGAWGMPDRLDCAVGPIDDGGIQFDGTRVRVLCGARFTRTYDGMAPMVFDWRYQTVRVLIEPS